MHAAFPLLNLEIWSRVLFAAAVVIWAPGHLLVGRWQTGSRPLDRLVLSLAVGLALPFLFNALLGRVGIPFGLLPYVGFAMVLVVVSHLWPRWRDAIRGWTEHIREPGRMGTWAAAASIPLMLVPILLGHGSFSAPPHVNDASNHAWVTQRVGETQRIHPDIVQGDGPGFVDASYVPGLHASAAVLSRLSGVAPYITTWLLVMVLMSLIPAAWSLLWRAWSLPLVAVSLGTLLVVANPLGPAGVLSWGGFGQIVGFFMVPAGAAALKAAWRRPDAARVLAAGTVLGAMAFLHFSELVVAIGAALLISSDAGGDSWIRSFAGLILVFLVIALIAVPELLAVSGHYGSSSFLPTVQTKGFGDVLERWSRAGGRDLLQGLMVLGIVVGLRRHDTRKLALVSLGLGAWYLSLYILADPISQWLAHPFYRQAPRILYLQFYVLPPLMALPLLWLDERMVRRGLIQGGRALIAAIVVLALGMGLSRISVVLESMRSVVPFGSDDYEHAAGLGDRVAEDEIVANFWGDGSTWAMQVSGRRFLQPAAWRCLDAEGRSLRETLALLVEGPWPDELRGFLLEEEIRWLYVSDTRLEDSSSRLQRSDFDSDPRFVELSRGQDSSLYRIEAPISISIPSSKGSD